MYGISDFKAINYTDFSKSYQRPAFLSKKINFGNKVPESSGDVFVKTRPQETPDYFLHFTTEDTAKEIIESGEIDVTADGIDTEKSGVFMVDLKNLVKNWTKQNVNANEGSFNLLTCLLGQTSKGEPKISCFKIPKQRLDDDLLVRNQKELIDSMETGIEPEFVNLENYDISKNDNPIEYLHCGKIPVNEEDLVGTVEMPEILQNFYEDCDFGESLSKYGSKPDKASLDLLKKLFADKPEEQDIKNAE